MPGWMVNLTKTIIGQYVHILSITSSLYFWGSVVLNANLHLSEDGEDLWTLHITMTKNLFKDVLLFKLFGDVLYMDSIWSEDFEVFLEVVKVVVAEN